MLIEESLLKEVQYLKSQGLSIIEIQGRIRRQGALVPFILIQKAYRAK